MWSSGSKILVLWFRERLLGQRRGRSIRFRRLAALKAPPRLTIEGSPFFSARLQIASNLPWLFLFAIPDNCFAFVFSSSPPQRTLYVVIPSQQRESRCSRGAPCSMLHAPCSRRFGTIAFRGIQLSLSCSCSWVISYPAVSTPWPIPPEAWGHIVQGCSQPSDMAPLARAGAGWMHQREQRAVSSEQ
jgi:hypothetical protein